MNLPMDGIEASLEIAEMTLHVADDDIPGQAYIAMLSAIIASKYRKAYREFMS